MTKITLLSAICVWHCVVNGQLAVMNNFHPYHPYNIPYYTSTVISTQPTNQNYAEMEAQLLGGTDNLRNIPNMRNSPFQGVIFLQIKRLQATTANLLKQLKDTTDSLKATQAELVSTKKAVSDLTTELQTTQTTLGTKAAQADLVTTNKAVNDLTTQLQTTKTSLDTKAAQADLQTTNQNVDNLKNELKTTNNNLDTKAARIDLAATNNDVSNLKAITSPNSIGKIPTSCGDLKTIGFVKSGIYSVVSQKQIQNVYCDFTKSLTPDFQKTIGYVNVKSSAVYFYAQRDGIYDIVNTGIPFNKINLNEGTALDGSTGEFLAPLTGKNFFAYSGLCWNNEAKIQLHTKTTTPNWSKIGDAHCTSYNTLSIQSTLQLAKGDQVRIFLLQGKTHDDGNNFTNYVGWLLEEDIN